MILYYYNSFDNIERGFKASFFWSFNMDIWYQNIIDDLSYLDDFLKIVENEYNHVNYINCRKYILKTKRKWNGYHIILANNNHISRNTNTAIYVIHKNGCYMELNIPQYYISKLDDLYQFL